MILLSYCCKKLQSKISSLSLFPFSFVMLREKTLGENELLQFKHMHWKWQKYSLGVISQDYIFPWFAKGGWLEAKQAPVELQFTINAHFIYHRLGRDLGKGNIISSSAIVGRRESKLRIVREEWFLNLTKWHRERGFEWKRTLKDAFMLNIKLNLSSLKQFVVVTCYLLSMPNWKTLRNFKLVLILYPLIWVLYLSLCLILSYTT